MAFDSVRLPEPVFVSPPEPLPMMPEISVFPAPAMVRRLLPLMIEPPRVNVPELLVKVLAAPSVELIPQVLAPELVKSPFRVKALPVTLKPPELNVTAPMLVRTPPEMSLAFVKRVAPEKMRVSPFTGAVPPQFAAVDQLLSAPLPFQVIVAPDTGSHPEIPQASKQAPLKCWKCPDARSLQSRFVGN